ncbi:MAG: hypothetical protein UX08_C0017G0002 [Candidatus Collierbacteria bacterium GW2011_GWB1_45_35]|uniref:RanBP2-type domain-containing protein n=1 Tax=Candidatus Collierbacteria bacterium GW2011_GWB2_45_17 TaxID=1618388 RepID=A0A837IHI3_9BACT|nr:MAG: hypothetical protein UW48_C0010G0036 [Microgenomates group bacterium GW2011_GWC1_44_23]KKT99261.1 MAG: hypothetical protein UX01_C0011G0026 [Candidatus Collierbacteria bacterium GW2011_GWB2_45_17]KKU04744.1 MAG: hypothetical protein UX08_C0017G0002 [Candidatus Collierbacteria bacterium GW2011_GWB1_45_35]HBC45250.1 hypothetical protein [Candidatus Collierbacteria bacterium]HCX25552.1 hypothetical protein [Candidatus Collierbacteria bacterium]
MAKIVMFWDCPYCRNKKIPGYFRECKKGCGAPRPRTVSFYHSNPITYATEAQTKLFGKADPNWYCEGCEAGNLDKDSKCWKCGAPRTTKSVVGVKRTGYRAKDLAHSTEEAEKQDSLMPAEPPKKWIPEDDLYNPQTGDEPVLKSKSLSIMDVLDEGNRSVIKTGALVVATLTAIIIGSLLIYNYFFKTHIETVIVTAMPWTQSVHIEEYQLFHEQGWSIPGEQPGTNSAGRQTNVDIRKSGDLKVHDGWTTETVSDTCYESVTVPDTCTGSRYVSDTCYSNNGDGSSDSYECGSSESYTYSCTTTESRSYACTKVIDVELYHYEDIMSPWYWYDIDRWTTIGTYPTSGNGTEIYYDSIQPSGDKQRRVEDGGTYSVTFGSEKADSKITPFTNVYDLATFLTFYIGQPHEVDVNYFGGVLDLR